MEDADTKPMFDKMTVELVQDGNTLGTTSGIETLLIRLETQLPGEDPFIVLETAGWSLDPDDIDSLSRVMRGCMSGYKTIMRETRNNAG